MSEPRFFPNRLEELDAGTRRWHSRSSGRVTLDDGWRSRLLTTVDHLLVEWETAIGKQADHHDCSVYTGIAGYAMLYMKMYKSLDKEEAGEKASRLLSRCEHGEKRRDRISFLCGSPGALVLQMELRQLLGKSPSQSLTTRLLEMKHDALRCESNELLYGKAGYLYALTRAHKVVGDHPALLETINEVREAILADGRRLAGPFSINFEWHGKAYLGAAHGLCGILFILLCSPGMASDSHASHLIASTVDELIASRLPSHNLPSSVGNNKDRLVQWCHGAPGLIHTLAQAHRIYGHRRYLRAMEECAEVVWERGLLTKGYGLCHGTSGSVYALLDVFRATKNPLHLDRALMMSEWMFEYKKHACRLPDRPYSLFEGVAGLLFLLVDLLDPENAKFPAFY